MAKPKTPPVPKAVEAKNFEQILQDKFKLPEFRLGQKEIIQAILAKKDVLAVLPTGGGKSLCYQYPAVYLNQLVIVISPLIALMKDQVLSLKRNGIPAGCLYSTQTEEERKAVFANIKKGGAFVLYLSPERAQKDGFQKWIGTRPIALFAIDEAHCVSQWGHDFREEYSQLNILKKLRPDVPILALTASATPIVLTDIAKNLRLRNPEKMVHGFYRPNLYYQVEPCANEEEKLGILLQAINQNPEGRILIYCGTRKVTEELARFLQDTFAQVGYYHAGMSPSERTKTQEDYINSKLRILVATNAFGMGIDQADVRMVLHFQMPGNIDSLYQEMGRAGRDGKDSTCVMLYSKKDKGLQSFFIQTSAAPSDIKEARYRNLDMLIAYAEGGECRHAEILTYYKDSERITKCGHCDSCDPTSPRRIQRPAEEQEPVSVPQAFKPSVKRTRPINTTIMDEVQEKRYQQLRNWRKIKATELDMPAFFIFSDRTLRDMAIKNPRTINEMRSVFGIGEQKLEKFGWDLLAELGHK